MKMVRPDDIMPEPPRPANPLLTAPILPTLLKLALPNTVAMFATTLVAVAETSYIGRLGSEPLAAIALVFPFVMLVQMLSAGAMGGGVSSAVSRAIGSGDTVRAATLALHAGFIGILGGLFLTLVLLVFGSALYQLLGGRGRVLEEALSYSHVLFAGCIAIWLVNTLASVLRGTGSMRVPSAVLLGVALCQVVAGGALGLGWGPIPRYGMAGVAAGQLLAFTGGAAFLIWYLVSGRSRLKLSFAGFKFEREMFMDILRVGAVASLSPLQSVLTVLIFTRILSSFGNDALAGYGIGARLEFLLVPIAFSVGVASVPMVGMAIGAGDVRRARRSAWTAGAVSAVTVGILGLVAAIFPDLWIGLFTNDPGIRAAATIYLQWAGPTFGFLGVGLCLYFASQGAAKVLGPVMAGTLRLLVVIIGGIWLTQTGAPLWTLFALVAASLTIFGIAAVGFVWITPWKPRPKPVLQPPPVSP